MAVPSSSTLNLSLFKIALEMEFNDYTNTMPYSIYRDSVNGATPVSLTNMSTGAGGFDAINTANASADRPDGSTPHSMSEFYSYDHDKTALTLLQTITGQQHSSQTTSSTQYSINVGAFKGKTVRAVFHYVSGSNYTGDVQLDVISMPWYGSFFGSPNQWQAMSTGFGGSTFSAAQLKPNFTLNGNWENANLGNIQTTRTDTTSHTNATWYDITTGSSNLRWNGRTGGTPSGGTGMTTMLGYHVYAEVSSAFNKNFWMRTPEWNVPNEVGSGNIGFTYGAYGSNMGTLKLYVQEV
jgi:hypothetical protein